MRVIVDAMGGDYAPAAVCRGALTALREHPDLRLLLVGDEGKVGPIIEDLLRNDPAARCVMADRLNLFHAPDQIGPGEEPVQALRRKKDSSLATGLRLLRSGEGRAFLSAGNTGAIVAGAVLLVGRLPGVERPVLAAQLPTVDGRGFLFLDLGASSDMRVGQLVQAAVMGAVFAREILGYANPSLGLLNIGAEGGKGDQLRRQTADELTRASQQSNPPFYFAGNVEARDLFARNTDIVLTDGFTGNVVLKTVEGTAETIFGLMKQEVSQSVLARLAALLMRPALRRVRDRLDYSEYGGALVLGADGVCIKCHGSSKARAIANGIGVARDMLKKKVVQRLAGAVAEGDHNDD